MRPVPNSQHEYQGASAERYDDLRTRDPKWKREQEIVSGYLRAVIDSESTVLDVPVGTGRFLPIYEQIGCTVTGVDVSDDMLAEARSLATDRQSLIRGDITRLDLGDSSVDVAVCVRFVNLVDLDTARRALAEVVRVTNTYVILGVRTRPDRRGLRSKLRQLRERVHGGAAKLTVHTSAELASLFGELQLATVERETVVEAKDASSTYSLYLLQLEDRNQ